MDEQAKRDQETQFYAALVNAWFTTHLEHDRSLLGLSAGGIAILVTLVLTVKLHSPSIEVVILFIGALLAFTACLVCVLVTFRLNASHLEAALKDPTARSRSLQMIDTIAIGSFIVGVLLSIIIGIATAIRNIEPTETCMTKDNINLGTTKEPLTKSFEAVNNLRPTQPPASPPPQDTTQGQSTTQSSGSGSTQSSDSGSSTGA